ncbi:zf-HC2 domain-containing protein [Fictibacillus iocasae]|uniref:Anti-sigma-W factor RsiW n=1 Tax=Fictibacillus iocasae TaxID=2715437 RepID=A0ABW2NTC6_9BACL
MGCEKEYYDNLMNKVMDGDADASEQEQFESHLGECAVCRAEYEAVSFLLDELETSDLHAPVGFTAAVMSSLPYQKRKFHLQTWLKRHPFLTAAAVFMLFMAASVTTLFNQQDLAVIEGEGNLVINEKEKTVTVPKGEVIKGDLVVENADVRIEGKVEGDVTVVKGNQYLASAGEVTGDSKEIGAVVEWIWYKLKSITPGADETSKSESRGYEPGLFFVGN